MIFLKMIYISVYLYSVIVKYNWFLRFFGDRINVQFIKDSKTVFDITCLYEEAILKLAPNVRTV